MSNRFTETDKWEDAWFRRLPPNAKLLYLYMLDKCDIAGFWEIDIELASMFTKLTKPAVLGAKEALSRGYLECDGYIWIKKFIKRQRNWPLNPDNNAHKAILSKLKSHSEFEVDFLEELSKIISPCLAPNEGLCKGSVKVKVKVEEQSEEFLKFWSLYRRKEAKGYAWKAWQKLDPNLFEKIFTAAAEQSKSWAFRGTELRYIPLPATWLNGGYYENEKTVATEKPKTYCVVCGKPSSATVSGKALCKSMDADGYTDCYRKIMA